jgi:hypothetical protein
MSSSRRFRFERRRSATGAEPDAREVKNKAACRWRREEFETKDVVQMPRSDDYRDDDGGEFRDFVAVG